MYRYTSLAHRTARKVDEKTGELVGHTVPPGARKDHEH